MATVPSTGPISFSNFQLALGQASSLPVGMGDLRNSSLFVSSSGEIKAGNVRGIGMQPIFQTFAPDVRSNALGVYSVRLVNSNYAGPVMSIMRSSDNTSNDFYSDYNGNLKMSNGSNYADWSNGTLSVMTWYDQSGSARNATATTTSGGNPPQLVTDPAGSGKYCIYFPNSNATASAYYGFNMNVQTTQSMICSYYTLSNSSGFQTLLSSNADRSIRFMNNVAAGGSNFGDFMWLSGGYTLYDGTFSATNPYFTNTNGAWHTIAYNSASATMNFIHIGYLEVSTTWVSRSFYGYMTDMFTFNSALPLYPIAGSSSNNAETQIVNKFSHIPFWRDGLVGSYTADSWSNNQWDDLSGSGNHATSRRGTISVSNISSISGVGGLNYLVGGTNDGIYFPTAVLPSNYTLFHVTRYNGSNQKRIVSASNTNWLSGHWSFQLAFGTGVAFHNNWITPSNQNPHGSNWVLSTDQNNLYRSGQSNRTIGNPGTPSFGNLGVNIHITEPSDWAITNITVYNRTLASNQYLAIEDYLASRYCLPFPIQDGLVCSLCANDFTSGNTTWIDRTGLSNNFTLTASTVYGTSANVPCMIASGATGNLTRTTSTPFGKYTTFIIMAQLLNYTSDWRTLLKGSSDHHFLIQVGTNNIGFYSGSFIPCDTNVNASTLTNVYSKFNMWVICCSTVSPYFQFYYNPSNVPLTPTGQIVTNANAAIKQGLLYIGSNGGNATQYFGNIAQLMQYNRRLSDREVVDIYNRYKAFYSL
jgi:hypothetical protein